MCSSAKIDYLKWAALALVVQYFWKQFLLIVEICILMCFSNVNCWYCYCTNKTIVSNFPDRHHNLICAAPLTVK